MKRRLRKHWPDQILFVVFNERKKKKYIGFVSKMRVPGMIEDVANSQSYNVN